MELEQKHLDALATEMLEHLDVAEQELLKLEKGEPDARRAAIHVVFRAMHSVKGAAGFTGMDAVKRVAHALESVLDELRRGRLEADADLLSALFKGVDTLSALLEERCEQSEFDGFFEQISPWASADGTVQRRPRAKSGGTQEDEGDVGFGFFDLANTALEEFEDEEDGFGFFAQEGDNGDIDGSAGDIASDETEGFGFFATGDPTSESPQPKTSDSAPPRSKDNLKRGDQGARKRGRSKDESVRVPVRLLDQLMSLVGEIVLIRNRQLQHFEDRLRRDRSLSDSKDRRFVQQLDLATSDLQEAVLRTRMQPVGLVFARLPRVVRDLGVRLKKKIKIVLNGEDVEVDKTILECIGDPLVHAIRNACDHGLETPEQRKAAGKDETGTIEVSAFHDAGHIVVSISDDGAGINTERVSERALSAGIITREDLPNLSEKQIHELVFEPGFSTASEVTDVSGRGVGMDVVRASVESVGGTLELHSRPGRGTTITLRVPLTLAIVSSLIVAVGRENFAIPQVNVEEVVCLFDSDIDEHLEQVCGQPVFRLRESLLPLVTMRDLLRHRNDPTHDENSVGHDGSFTTVHDRRLTFVVVRVARGRLGLIVDSALGGEQIVVKPAHPLLSDLEYYVGTTILGDGRVALILDVNGIARKAQVDLAMSSARTQSLSESAETESTGQLMFLSGTEVGYLLAVGTVLRIVPIQAAALHRFRDSITAELDGGQVHVLDPARHLEGVELERNEGEYFLILQRHLRRPTAILATQILDVVDVELKEEHHHVGNLATSGSVVIDGRQCLFLNSFALARLEDPHWFGKESLPVGPRNILLVEDTGFFRLTIKRFLESAGHTVTCAEDGQEAVDLLKNRSPDFDIIISDIEMPRMDGFELIERIRNDQSLREWAQCPALALTSLDTEPTRQRALASGFHAFELKLDETSLLEVVQRLTTHTHELVQAPRPIQPLQEQSA